ncbi:hypothetical protein DFH94DRAFT_730965 [Russula ochroleuca]|uniref:DASH complex subunit DUO1 n=1 Tax=Russula ochroleuca TaxID=152965 RepID=A0A9P5N079_9AGAM|nr:hypothetical protein DFH94DRAFT_730965 [Russula ochroleuca]
MDSLDSPNLLSGGSQLLDQSPQFSFNSASSSLHTGPGGDDLSLSELYPDNRPPKTEPQTRHNPKTRPSIAEALGFGAPLDQSDDQSVLHALEEGEEREEDAGVGEDEEGTEADVTVRVGDEDADRTSIATQSREEKLQSDLFVLRQLNGAFAVYNDALREAQGGTERLAEQLEQTDALLNKYINVLSKSEQVKRLIFDERWMGAEADEAQLEEEERVREEKRRREEDERQQAAQREQERKEKEELERAMRDEAERLGREKRDKTSARGGSGVRGVRGTRASMRAGVAARGGSRTGSVPSTAIGSHTKAPSGSATGPSKIARPSSLAVSSARGTSIPRGFSKRP